MSFKIKNVKQKTRTKFIRSVMMFTYGIMANSDSNKSKSVCESIDCFIQSNSFYNTADVNIHPWFLYQL